MRPFNSFAEVSTPKKLRQTTLGTYLSSSPGFPSPERVKSRYSMRHSRKFASHESRLSADEGDTSDVGAIQLEPEVVTVSDSSEYQPSQRPKKKRKMRLVGVDSEGEHIDRAKSETDSEADVGVPVRWISKGKRRGKRAQIADTDSDSELQSRKRKLVKGVRPPTPEDLVDEVETEKIIEQRLRSRGKVSVFQKNLEKFKRHQNKRRGLAEISFSDSEKNEESDASHPAPFVGARPGSVSESSDHSDPSDGQDDNFIVEDDPSHPIAVLPLQFRNQQDLAFQFKIVCQLFVHLTVHQNDQPAFMERALRDEYFASSLSVIRRKMDGLRDSLVTSSAWRPNFKKPLETFPYLRIVHLRFSTPGCQACHLGGRKSSRLARLSGQPYNPVTFEPASQSDESSDSEDKDNEQSTNNRRVVPNSTRALQGSSEGDFGSSSGEEDEEIAHEFYLGRFCARRARTFHNFVHWECHLFRYLLREVNVLRNADATFIPVAFPGGVKPHRTDDADGIMEWLDQRGVIEQRWNMFKELMESARSLDIKKGQD